jgi:hypothetical protein
MIVGGVSLEAAPAATRQDDALLTRVLPPKQ